MINKMISTNKIKNICEKIKKDVVSISDRDKDHIDRAEIRGICIGVNLLVEQLNLLETNNKKSAL